MPSTVLHVAAKQALPSSAMRRVGDHIPHVERNVGSTERLVSLGLGTCLTVFGITGRRTSPLALAAGGFLLYRGLAGNCPLYQALGVGTGGTRGDEAVIPAREGVKVEQSVTVDRPAAEVYRCWRDLSRLPQFMGHLKEVRETAGGKSHWVATGPLGMSVEWDAEVIEDRPNEVISWRSLPGSDVDTAGSVHFRSAPTGRGTEVRVALEYDPPAGKVGAAVARLLGESPEQQIAADLCDSSRSWRRASPRAAGRQGGDSRRHPVARRPARTTDVRKRDRHPSCRRSRFRPGLRADVQHHRGVATCEPG